MRSTTTTARSPFGYPTRLLLRHVHDGSLTLTMCALSSLSPFQSFKRFQANPELFNDYHVGFREQTTGWNEFRNSKPKKDKKDKKDKKGKKDKQKKDKHKEGANANANANAQAEGGVNGNPVNWIIEFIRRGASSSTGGPSGSSVTVADFGCGDAAIGESFGSQHVSVYGAFFSLTFFYTSDLLAALSLTSKKSKNSSQTNFIVHSLEGTSS